MIYLFCSLFGLAALALAGTMGEGDSYGRCGRLVETVGGTVFPLFSYTTIGGGQGCDINLSRYGCASGVQAEIALKNGGQFCLKGQARVSRKGGGIADCLNKEVVLSQGDCVTLTMANGRCLKLKFERE